MRALIISQKTIWKTLSNVNRINILYKLYEGDQIWSDLMFSLRINPKSLRDHLNFLEEYNMVTKNDGVYSLTDFGKEVCELKFVQEIRAGLSVQLENMKSD